MGVWLLDRDYVLTEWRGYDLHSTPSASSPKPWTKMKAADLVTSLGAAVGGRIIGGLRSGAILLAV